jgi:hypothetical protein
MRHSYVAAGLSALAHLQQPPRGHIRANKPKQLFAENTVSHELNGVNVYLSIC